MTLGQRIQQIRIDHYLSQEEFAEKLDITRQTVSRWELDQICPGISKIVLISKVFSVSTDSILKDGISTFDTDIENYTCGVFRGSSMEVVETDRFALVLYCTADKNTLGMKLYYGFDKKKKLTAICERNLLEKKTEYAYLVKDGDPHVPVTNSERLASLLTVDYDPEIKNNLRRTESFSVDHSGAPLPTVKEAGIPKCLELWSMYDDYDATHTNLDFSLHTEKSKYYFSINAKSTDIYCGAFYNIVFDLGMFEEETEYFRIRDKKNSDESCWCCCNFATEPPKKTEIPTEQCGLGKLENAGNGSMCCVKRYNDDEIVLHGCGDREYICRRNDKRTEQFLKE